MQRLLSILSIVVLSEIAFSQSEFRFKHLTTNDGLSQNSVYAICQDSVGFLWFGTQDGLNRFDGVSCKVYKHHDDDSTSLSDNYILGITEDKSNNLWIATRNGANRFDKRTETCTRYYFPEIFGNDFHQSVREILVTHDSSVVMLLPDGLYSFSPRDNFTKRRRICEFQKENPGMKAVQDEQHNIWITTTTGILCVTSNGVIACIPYPHQLQITGFVARRRDELWLSAGNNLAIFNLRSRSFAHFPLDNGANNFVRFIYVDSQERIWVTTNEKVILLSETLPGTFHQKVIQRKEGDPFSLNDEAVQSVFEDKSGLFWLGTVYGGVNLYDPLQMHFKTIGQPLLKTLPTVWAICEDSRKLVWFGTSGGLVKATRRDTSKPITSYQAIEDAFASFEAIPIRVLSTQITSILEDDEHQLWIGIRGNGVVRYNVEKQTFRHYIHSESDTNSLINNSVLSMRKLSNGEIWICTFQGISIVDIHKEAFSGFRVTSFDTKLNNYVIDVYEAKDGIVWISTSNGILQYDRKNNISRSYQHKEGDSRTLSYNIAASCREDGRGKLWIATLGGGLNYFDSLLQRFFHSTTEDGLQNDVVYGICKDTRHQLWLSTNEGISRFSTETKAFTNFGIEEGLQFKEFALNSFFQNEDGEMFFGGVGGAVVFYPDSVAGNRFIPPVVISDLRINYKSLDSLRMPLVRGSYTIPEEIHLSYLEKALTLEFVALNFRNASKNIYQYKLEGFDDHWIVPEQHQRVAHYTNLPPGEFTFIVKAANNSGVWNEAGLRIKIIVFPPFWLSRWFLATMSIMIIGGVVFSVRVYSHRKLRRTLQALEVQQKIQNERERISRDLHDNVGSQLVNIISGLDIAGRLSETSKEKTMSLLSSLQEDARTSMGLLRQTIWALKTNALTAEQFSNELEHYIRKQCSYHEEVALRYDAHISHVMILSPIQVLNLLRITQEALTNIFKYAQAQNVFVSFSLSNQNVLTLVIKDDGIGFKEQHAADSLNGNGLLNMESRAKELGGTIRWVNMNGVTVEVIIKFPG